MLAILVQVVEEKEIGSRHLGVLLLSWKLAKMHTWYAGQKSKFSKLLLMELVDMAIEAVKGLVLCYHQHC